MSDTIYLNTTEDHIADDTLRGAAKIAAHIGDNERRVNYLLEQGKLPAFKIGRCWHMRKSTYRKYIAELEAKAMSRVAA